MHQMTRDEFWGHIERCRACAAGMREFNELLESMLDAWGLAELAAFHKVMWDDIGVYHDDGELWNVMCQAAEYVGSDKSWESYGGWLIAQGREFFEAAMRDLRLALRRVPAEEDVLEGESVIFAAQRVCLKKTGNKWSLYDLFGYDLSGKPLPGIDPPRSVRRREHNREQYHGRTAGTRQPLCP